MSARNTGDNTVRIDGICWYTPISSLESLFWIWIQNVDIGRILSGREQQDCNCTVTLVSRGTVSNSVTWLSIYTTHDSYSYITTLGIRQRYNTSHWMGKLLLFLWWNAEHNKPSSVYIFLKMIWFPVASKDINILDIKCINTLAESKDFCLYKCCNNFMVLLQLFVGRQLEWTVQASAGYHGQRHKELWVCTGHQGWQWRAEWALCPNCVWWGRFIFSSVTSALNTPY